MTKDPGSLEHEALELLKRGDLGGAHDALTRLLAFRPNDQALRARLRQIEAIMQQRSQAHARIQADPIRYAHAYIKAGRLTEGLQLLRGALSRDPSNEELRELALDVARRLQAQSQGVSAPSQPDLRSAIRSNEAPSRSSQGPSTPTLSGTTHEARVRISMKDTVEMEQPSFPLPSMARPAQRLAESHAIPSSNATLSQSKGPTPERHTPSSDGSPHSRTESEDRARREAFERMKREVEERKIRDAETRARKEAEDRVRREAEDRARREAFERAKREAEDRARREAEDRARREAEDIARREAEDIARREAEDAARREAEDTACREAEDTARREAEDSAREAELRALRETMAVKKAETVAQRSRGTPTPRLEVASSVSDDSPFDSQVSRVGGSLSNVDSAAPPDPKSRRVATLDSLLRRIGERRRAI